MQANETARRAGAPTEHEERAPDPVQTDERAKRASAPDSARILILDYGSQYTQLIARRVREAGVYSEIHAPEIAPDRLAEFGASGIILSGGPESVGTENAPTVSDAVAESGVPLLGICYGMQALAEKFGGTVQPSAHREFGYAEVSLASGGGLGNGIRDGLLGGLAGDGGQLKVWMSHGDRVETLPAGFERIASTENAPLAGMADPARHIYGLQFHPEVTHTEHGQTIVERFVRGICGCPDRWTPGNIVTEHIERVRREVGKERVLLGLSGGVDSSVVAALLHAAIGDQLVFYAWLIAATLAAVAGTMYGIDKSYKPFTYFQLLLPIFASAILGGIGHPIGAVAGGFIVALSETSVTYAYKKFLRYLVPESWEPSGLMQLLSTDYKLAISFVILVVVLLVRPTGIFRGRVLS